MKMSDTYDVIDEVSRKGICSPFNNHSYKGTLIFIPCICSSCKEMIYPLITAAVTCLRCHFVSHRGSCMRSTKAYCCKVDRQCDGTMLAESKSSSILEEKQILPTTQNNDFFTEMATTFDELKVKGLTFDSLLPRIEATLIPPPGSINCIWRSKLQSIADQQIDVIRPRESRNFNIFDDQFNVASDLLITSILSDLSSFPGVVCSTLHSIYLDTRFASHKETLSHARECLDAISCAILSILPAEIPCPLIAERISNIVDRYVLGISHRAMYVKVFLAAQLINELNDQKFSFIGTDEVKVKKDNAEQSLSPISIFLHTAELISPRDKLKQLGKAVQLISNDISLARSTTGESLLVERDSLDIKPSSVASKAGNTANAYVDLERIKSSSVDADTLIELVSNVLHIYQYSLSETDPKICPIFWFAECTYIESMMREGDWELGIESYALTTIMQALQTFL